MPNMQTSQGSEYLAPTHLTATAGGLGESWYVLREGLSSLIHEVYPATASLIRRNSLRSIRHQARVADVGNTEIRSFLPAPGGRPDRQRDSRSALPASRLIPARPGPPLAHTRSKTAPHSETPRRDSPHPRPHGRVETLRGVPRPAQRLPQAPQRFCWQAILPAQPFRAFWRLQASGAHSARCQCRGGLHSWQSYNQRSLRPATVLGSLSYSSSTRTRGCQCGQVFISEACHALRMNR